MKLGADQTNIQASVRVPDVLSEQLIRRCCPVGKTLILLNRQIHSVNDADTCNLAHLAPEVEYSLLTPAERTKAGNA